MDTDIRKGVNSSLLGEIVMGQGIGQEQDKPIYWECIVYVCAGFLFFLLNNVTFLNSIVPASVKARSVQGVWKWKNVANSFTHSCITGVGALFSFWAIPKMAEDLISTHCSFSHILVCVSIGYFLLDVVDMALNNKRKSTYELMVHHFFVIVCFGIAACTRYYVGFAMAALLAEVNSIFLHARQMMQLQGYQRDHVLYRINSFINIGTFVAFRIIVFSWMTRWMVINRDAVSLPSYTVGSIGLAIIVLMNIVLFFRVLKADFKKHFQKKEGVMKLLEEDHLEARQSEKEE